MVLETISANVAPPTQPQLKAADAGPKFTEKSIAAGFESINAKFANPDWEVHVDAMESLQDMVDRGAGSHASFMSLFVRYLREPLIEQCIDIRVAINKVACATVSLLSVKLGAGFSKVADIFVKNLVKQVRDGVVQCVVDFSSECVMTIIANTHAGRIIPGLVQIYGDDKSPVCRAHCMDCIAYILQRWGEPILRKHSEALTSVLKTGLSDASPAARSAARDCFCHMQKRWPAKAANLQTALDPTTARQVGALPDTSG